MSTLFYKARMELEPIKLKASPSVDNSTLNVSLEVDLANQPFGSSTDLPKARQGSLS